MRKTTYNHSPKQAHASDAKEQENEKNKKKVSRIIGGESEALGFHQETTEDSRK